MITTLLIMGFFISVTACLRFSAWAESWMVPTVPAPAEPDVEVRP